jgi:hypothetical protein
VSRIGITLSKASPSPSFGNKDETEAKEENKTNGGVNKREKHLFFLLDKGKVVPVLN